MLRNYLLKMVAASVFLLIFSAKFVDLTLGERVYEYPLETAWKAMGIPLCEVNIEAWMKLNNRKMSLYELKQTARELQKNFNLKLKTGMNTGEQEQFSYLSFEGVQTNGTSVTITIQSTRTEENSETQLGINTVHNGEITDLRRYIQNLKDKIAALGSDLDFRVAFWGERSGKLTPLLVRELSGRAFRKIRAELVDSTFDEDQSRLRGFTSLITESIDVDTRPVNIEFGARYDRTRNVTQIVLAAPTAIDGV